VGDWSLNGQLWNWQTASISGIDEYLTPPWSNTAWQYCSDGTMTPCSGGNPPGDVWPPKTGLPLSIDGDVEDTLVLCYSGNRELPFTSLITPPYGAIEQPLTPQFTWVPVEGAYQYSLAIATSVSALPTSYQQTSCSACTLFATTSNTSYTVPSGVMQLGATYYWEVQADSGVYKGGNWTSPYSFTTGSDATQIQSVVVNPASFGSGSYAVVSVTLNGIAPSNGATVGLVSSNNTAFPLPSSINVPVGQTTASISVLSGPVTVTTTVSVSASYNGTQTASITILPNNGVITTLPATMVTGSAAALNGTVNPEGANGQYQFEWSTDPTLNSNVQTSCSVLGSYCPAWVENSKTQMFTYQISGLPSLTTYYFRLNGYDSDNNSYWYGAIQSFTTQ
jgi:hypothetical protein